MIKEKDKDVIRQRKLEERKSLEAGFRLDASDRIRDLLSGLDEWKSAQAAYLYMGTGSEVSTEALITEALSEGKAVYLPKVVSESDMFFYRIYSVSDLKEGAYGIMEPDLCECASAEEDKPDIVLIPCVACDRAGHRIGHGKGYYDRFLKRAGNALRVCLAFDCQMEDEIPTDDHDVNMDVIVTETGIIRI